MSTLRLPFLLLAAFATTALPAQEVGLTPLPGVAPDGSMPAPAPAASFVPGRMIQMRPEQKRPLLLQTDERNPYAKRNPQEEQVAAQDNSEELRIRARLGALHVTGRIQGTKGLRILLGDIILEEGRLLPQLIENQSESLRVVELNEDAVVLGWLDIETGELTGKTMQIGYDLSPSISYALHGQDPDQEDGAPAQRRLGVLRYGQDFNRTESNMATKTAPSESSAPSAPAPKLAIPREAYQAGQ